MADRNEKGQFLLGHSAFPGVGRPRGSRAKLAEIFIEDMYEHWLSHGKDAIEHVWKASPVDYLKVVASLLPRDLNLNVSVVDKMSPDELRAEFERLIADPELADFVAKMLEGMEAAKPSHGVN